MRGIAILMVIGIHSLPQPLNVWETIIDAILRPSVPIFLFVSGYLTALSGQVPLWKRLKAVVVPYTIAFAAAYIYMALHNPTMDHRPTTALARFILAYAFVYYYVFVYIGCTVVLWLFFRSSAPAETSSVRLVSFLLLAVLLGLTIGSYLDPLAFRLGFGESLVEEIRMRDVPFWFVFMALGTLAGMFRIKPMLAGMRWQLFAATVAAYVLYAAVRLFRIGDAADYDSIAFFSYAALFCCFLLACYAEFPLMASLGSGSYFIYLWHIFFVMLLRDHAATSQLTPATASAITYICTASASVFAMMMVRGLASAPVRRWLGA
ncbi:MAG: acyltransferase [Bradyrhizobium sp.]|nr:acyltransferase [Pseudomonadota bacterium]MDE2473350.1 acyltransferase [Bradyrhizobium sp.]